MCDCSSFDQSFDSQEYGPDEICESTIKPDVPLATAIVPDNGSPAPFPDSTESGDAGLPPQLPPGFPPQLPPIPPIKPCQLNFRDGCYALTVRPAGAARPWVGTLRVDRGGPASGSDKLIVSGDLYRSPVPVIGNDSPASFISEGSNVSSAAVAASSPAGIGIPFRPRIPIYPRNMYHSYLSGSRLSVPAFTVGHLTCKVTIEAEQFDYTHPGSGFHKGSFPAAASRTLRFVLDKLPPGPIIFGGPRFAGRYFEGGVDKGSVHLTWVSSFLRRAVLEIDTLTGAVAPAPVPATGGSGTEYFDTVFAGAKWDLTVLQDQAGVAVPAGVNPNQCWTSGNLHNLMTAVRKPATNLDAEWRTHLVVVPAAMGCSRGVMYDQIGVPREGSASFSNDGYPKSNSSNFGAAENQQQRNVPRAFLRSATHEVTHAFNQIHQEQETMADNSIMTTTPSVADVLGGPATGAPGVFPDQINLGFNPTVRNHLAHMPDPVVRPGGWPFGSWFGSLTQAGDREWFNDDELALAVSVDTSNAAFGAPVGLTWTLTNTGATALTVPTDIGLEGLFGTLTVTDDRGNTREVRPFVINCETVKLDTLEPGDNLTAGYRVFWSTEGFALDRPGRHTLTIAVCWSANGVPVGVSNSADVWVDHPTSDRENADAALVMHPEVGKWVALGGDAYHLTDATERLRELATAPEDIDGESRVVQAFAGLLPGSSDGGDTENVNGGDGGGPGGDGNQPGSGANRKTTPQKPS